MPPLPPQTAAAAIVEFAGDLFAAMFLRASLYARVAADPRAWRRAAVVVIIGALASDSLGLYSQLDLFLVGALKNWSILAIMLLALARWHFGAGAAWLAARAFGGDQDFAKLLRTIGYGYAPVAVHVVPALLYWLGLGQVTGAMVAGIRWLVLPWVVAALSMAAGAAGMRTVPRAVAVGLVAFVASNFFDVLLDEFLLGGMAMAAVESPQSDAVLWPQ